MHKRGISELISTVLLIGVTISAAAMIYSFVVPLIQSNIEQSQKCVSGLLEITQDYTCYNISSKELYIEIEKGNVDVNVTGIQILLTGGQSSGGVLIKEGPKTKEVRDFNASLNLTIPKKGETNTYVINMTALGFAPESATASPIVKLKTSEKLCDVSSQIPIGNC